MTYNQKDKITIIVPIYNVITYLEKCINSILLQTYSNIEVILIDDGSTDGSESLINEFEKKDNRVKCIHKQNGGLSSARNAGLDMSTGDYIVFVDGDDFILPETIEYLHNLIVSHNADIATIGYYRNERIKHNLNVKKIAFPKVCKGVECAEFLTGDRAVYPRSVWGKMYKNSVALKWKFPESLHFEDIYYSFVVSLHSNVIVIETSTKLYFYRYREGSITTIHTFNSHSYDTFYIWKKCYEESNNYPEIQNKCARRVIRSYINIIGEFSLQKHREIDSKFNEMNGLVENFYSVANLSIYERLCYCLCRYWPSLIGLGCMIRKLYRFLIICLHGPR